MSIKPSSSSSRVNNSSTGPMRSSEKRDPKLIKMLQEDRNKVMQRRIIALCNENECLKKQITREIHRTKELEQELVKIKNERIPAEDSLTDQAMSKSPLELAINPTILQEATRGICKSCQMKFQSNEALEPIVFITKSELETLDKDMQNLRDALRLKEQAWDKLAEREQNYCQQLTRLAQELITANQLADNRHEELQTMARTLEAAEYELKIVQKEIFGLKKIVMKQEKRNRSLESSNERQIVKLQINRRERRCIEGIIQQLSPRSASSKLNGKSQQSSPSQSNNVLPRETN